MRILICLTTLCLAACTQPDPAPVELPDLASEIRETRHDGDDDLLSAGLGLDGLRSQAPQPADPTNPMATELRRRAIHENWRSIADLSPLGGFGTVYGSVPHVPGDEFHAFMKLPEAAHPHRVLLQLPDAFDPAEPCLVVTPVSGSRGIYGAISLGGPWGLSRGCAVVYTDKGAGTDHFDFASDTGVQLDGTRAQRGPERGDGPLAWAPPAPEAGAPPLVGFKHAHSGDNPEADWGRHVLQSAEFALFVLAGRFPGLDVDSVRVLGAALSNGGGSILRALELDEVGRFDAVVAVAPNITAPDAIHLYDYATLAALLQPCLLADTGRASEWPLGTFNPALAVSGQGRCEQLAEHGLIEEGTPGAAYRALREAGFDDAALSQAALMTLGDVWRSVAVLYASAYARTGAFEMPCGYAFAIGAEQGEIRSSEPAERAAWWAASAGVGPGAGVGILDRMRKGDDPAFPGLMCLRELATGDSLRGEIDRTRALGRVPDVPVIVIHGLDDGLIPAALSSRPWVEAARANGAQRLAFWEVSRAQHFDSLLGTPGVQGLYAPLMPYAYAALDVLWNHLEDGAPVPEDRRIQTEPPGAGQMLETRHLGL